MKVSELFPKKYACGADLQGKSLTLKIARVVIVQMRPNPQTKMEPKGVVHFVGSQKGIILSRKMAEQIAEIAGTEEMNNWPGTRVTIYPEPMTVAGQARIAIRARAPEEQNGDGKPPASLQEDEEIIESDDEEEIIADPITGEIVEEAVQETVA